MKSLKVLALTALIAIAAVGCSKTEKILVKQDGTWKTTSSTTRYYNNTTLDSTVTQTTGFTETIKFEKDGIGSIIDTDTTINFTWSMNDDQSEITMCYDFFGLQICQKSTVLESEKDKQVWTSTDKTANDPYYTETDGTLERVK